MVAKVAGQVMRNIRVAEGHSLRDAEARTGIHRCVLNRIENGRPVRHLREVVEQFATAYHRRADLLIAGLDSRGAFSSLVASATPTQRSVWMQMSTVQRTALTAEFFLEHGGGVVTQEKLAREAEISEGQLQNLRSHWQREQGDAATSLRVARALCSLTGVVISWFTHGLLEGEAAIDGLTAEFDFFACKAAEGSNGSLSPKDRLTPVKLLWEMMHPGA